MLDSLFKGEKYSTEELNARLKFFIGIILGLTLFGIVFVVLYSLIFVVQPMNAMSPVDNKFFELIIPIATFLTGTLSGIMLAGDDKESRMKALDAATRTPPPSSPPPKIEPTLKPLTPAPSSPFGGTLNVPLGAASLSVSTTTETPEFKPSVSVGFGGKPAPTQPPQPEL